MSKKVRIVEVGARDGLQNEKKTLTVEQRIAFIDMLSDSGLQTIEAGAFVSPKWVPQMADSDKVLRGIRKKEGVSYPVLVPNERGMQAALDAGAREVAVFAAASESFSQKNINCSIDESIARFQPVMKIAKAHHVKVRGYVSCVLGCPYEDEVAPEAVVRVARVLYDMGCYEISLGDTIGTGTPDSTAALLRAVEGQIPPAALAVHFHDTHGRALANIRVALSSGIRVVDSSAGGLGGCPYAPGAAGNVATESVLALLEKEGFATGVDSAAVAHASRWIKDALSS